MVVLFGTLIPLLESIDYNPFNSAAFIYNTTLSPAPLVLLRIQVPILYALSATICPPVAWILKLRHPTISTALGCWWRLICHLVLLVYTDYYQWLHTLLLPKSHASTAPFRPRFSLGYAFTGHSPTTHVCILVVILGWNTTQLAGPSYPLPTFLHSNGPTFWQHS